MGFIVVAGPVAMLPAMGISKFSNGVMTMVACMPKTLVRGRSKRDKSKCSNSVARMDVYGMIRYMSHHGPDLAGRANIFAFLRSQWDVSIWTFCNF
jgi:hypothetical protein